ncbi:MAG: hypothetical protein KGS60_14545 [Verrucomicrobia bacterium]|nr:hypothetical protein [Verrucomicrobiota bacterium]
MTAEGSILQALAQANDEQATRIFHDSQRRVLRIHNRTGKGEPEDPEGASKPNQEIAAHAVLFLGGDHLLRDLGDLHAKLHAKGPAAKVLDRLTQGDVAKQLPALDVVLGRG